MAYKRRSTTGADGTRHTTTVRSSGGTTRSSSKATGNSGARVTTSQNSKTGKVTTTRSYTDSAGFKHHVNVHKMTGFKGATKYKAPKYKPTRYSASQRDIEYTNDDMHDLMVGAVQLLALVAGGLIIMMAGFGLLGFIVDLISNINNAIS